MPKQNRILTETEINLVLKIRGYVEILLLKDHAFGTLGATSARTARDLDSGLNRLVPPVPGKYSIQPDTLGKDEELTKEFFEELQRLLKQLVEQDGFGNRKTENAAFLFMNHAEGFARLF